jgi:hypothetical protein
VNPSIHSEAAVGKLPRGTVNRGDFVREATGEQDQLVLLWHDGAVVGGGDVVFILPPRVIDAQLPASELFGLAVKEVDECDFSARDFASGVVTVAAEEISVVAGCGLAFYTGDAEWIAAPFLQDSR